MSASGQKPKALRGKGMVVAETKVYWRSPDGKVAQTTIIRIFRNENPRWRIVDRDGVGSAGRRWIL